MLASLIFVFLKVKESGEGHTLSGKPLDPESAAARQYMGLPKLPPKEGQKERKKRKSKSDADNEEQEQVNGEAKEENGKPDGESESAEQKKYALLFSSIFLALMPPF